VLELKSSRVNLFIL